MHDGYEASYEILQANTSWTLIFKEIFARRLDMLRTGMGLANLNGFENGMGSITENDIPL